MSKKSTLFMPILIFLQLISCASSRSQQTQSLNYSERISSSIDVIKSTDSIPEQTIPDAILDNAYGLAIIPNIVKGAFIIGGRYGKGIITVKTDNGEWSYPSFISIGGGSVGWQWGVESIDLVLVFKSPNSIDKITEGKFTLGASGSVSAGPVGRHAEAATTTQLNAQIYSYARSQGVFLGASLEGTSLRIDDSANKTFYNSDTVTVQKIFKNDINPVPPLVKQFNQTLNDVIKDK